MIRENPPPPPAAHMRTQYPNEMENTYILPETCFTRFDGHFVWSQYQILKYWILELPMVKDAQEGAYQSPPPPHTHAHPIPN